MVGRLGGSAALRVIVLNAQPQPREWQRRGAAREAIRAQELGREATAPITERLGQAQIATKPRLKLGDPANTTIRRAKEEGCDLIVMGAKPLSGVGRRPREEHRDRAACVAAQAVQLSEIPVVPVK